MPRLSDVSNKALRDIIGNRVFSQPVLAINAGAAATMKTTVVPTGGIVYTVDGLVKNKANLSAQALTANTTLQPYITGLTGFYVQPANTTVYYLVVLDAAGTVTTLQGTYAGQSFTPFKTGIGDGSLPDIAVGATYTPIGYIKVVTGAVTFTPGTTALDAASITFTFVDVSSLPSSTAP